MAPSRHEIPVLKVLIHSHDSISTFLPRVSPRPIIQNTYIHEDISIWHPPNYRTSITLPTFRLPRESPVSRDEEDPSCKFERHRWHGKFLWKELWKEIDGREKDKEQRRDGEEMKRMILEWIERGRRWRSRISRTYRAVISNLFFSLCTIKHRMRELLVCIATKRSAPPPVLLPEDVIEL